MQGVVKSYGKEHGYGFIIGDLNEIFFAHATEFHYKNPQSGDAVTFDPVITQKGSRAMNVRRTKWETK